MSYFCRIIACVALFLSFTISSFAVQAYEYRVSARDKNIFKSAYAKTQKDQFGMAAREAGQAEDKTIPKIIKWVEYQKNPDNSRDIEKFMDANPHWPNMKALRNQAEFSLSVNDPADEVIRYFSKNTPVTGYGMLLFAGAKLQKNGDMAEISKLIKQGWQQGDFKPDDEEYFFGKYRKYLSTEDHYNRASRLLWEEKVADAKRLYPLLGEGHKQLLLARIKMMGKHPSDSVAASVPENLQNDAGLIYQRAKIQEDKENYQREYLLLRNIKGETPFAEKLWKLRNRLARELLDEKEYAKAYEIVKNHGNIPGESDYADAEWLAGWIALRFMNNPEEAYKHFYAMYKNVQYPVSLSRAAYWAGRAAEANKNQDIAKNWFQVAASYPTAFYGQLAYTKQYGRNAKLFIPANPEMGISPDNAPKIHELLQAAYIFESSGNTKNAERFIKAAITAAKNSSEMAYISEFGVRIGRDNFAVIAAKEALSKNVILAKHGWPVGEHIPNKISVEKPLALGIIRQESNFNPLAQSPANAMGMMQLIPPTAKRVAKSLGVNYSVNKLTKPEYNITLGSAYLGDLVNQFDGSYILAIASYNAGPGNVKKWISRYSDPRQMERNYQVIDWIESIPFGETRNYVQRVMENMQVYKAITEKSELTLEEDLQRSQYRVSKN